MPTRQFITISTPHSNSQIDLEVPNDEPIQSFLPDLIKVINWPEMLGSEKAIYHFVNESGQALDNTKSLNSLGIENFEILSLVMEGNGVQSDAIPQVDDSSEEDAHRRTLPLPPVWAQIPIDAPSLVSEQGVVFVLGEPPVSIGRKSSNYTPAIDLTDWDSKLLSSRRHAEILREGKTFVLHAFNTTNGTFINGSELPAGEKKTIENKDRIQFGFRGMELIFRLH